MTRLSARLFLSGALLSAALPQPLEAQRFPASQIQRAISDQRIQSATIWLDQISAALFRDAGERYITPRVVGYDGTLMTPCGRMPSDNAYACRTDGTIYYDRTFLSGLMVATSLRLPSDGGTAPVLGIAHEWGHELQFLLGLDYTDAVDRSERDADCLAGVLLARAQVLGRLRAGDLEEARLSIGLVGDSVLVPGEWGHVIERINANAAPGAIPVITNGTGYHGNANERLTAFNQGLRRSLPSCVAGIPRPGKDPPLTAVRWYVNNAGGAYDLGVAQNKPIVMVSGDRNGANFIRLKKETLESPVLAGLANVAIFVYTDPASDLVARNLGKALKYDRLPVISLFAPNANMIDEVTRIIGLWDAPTVLRELTKGMTSRGWLGATRTP